MNSKKITDVPGLDYLWQYENFFLAGQPTSESITSLKDQNIKKIFNLRADQEADQSSIIAKAHDLGIEYEQIPIMVEGALDSFSCKKLSDQVNDSENYLIHCASANRVGAWLITYLCQYKNMDFDDAVDIASHCGLTNPAFISQAENVVQP